MPWTTFQITWDSLKLSEVLGSDKKSLLVLTERFFEAETAADLGIPFDHNWYKIDVATREQMIATRLARTSVDNLVQLHAMRK